VTERPSGRGSTAREVLSRHVAARRLGRPRPAVVRVGADGLPVGVGGDRRSPARPAVTAVDSVREDWVVEDRWWSHAPLRRRYFELVLADGRDVVVFHDLVGGGWYGQRG
jgi:hypothetical protein